MKLTFASISKNWNTYWFSENMLFNASVARIFIGISALWNIYLIDQINYEQLLDPARQSFYKPLGLLQFLGNNLPSIEFFNVVRVVAYLSTIFFLFGFITKISNIISLISSLLIGSLIYSWGTAWGHGENVIYLMHLALLFAPCNRFFSVDAILFKKGGSFFLRSSNNGWGVILAITAAAIMFTNAGYYKVTQKPFLGWVFSDSIRNYIVQQYLVSFRTPIPDYLEWIVNNEVAYKTLAFLNILTQTLMIGVLLFMRKPWLRILFFLFFLCESLRLYFVMGYENLKWTPLAFIFIDWRWLINKFGVKVPELEIKPVSYSKWSSVFIISFITVFIITVFDKGAAWEKRYKNYTFSGFSMFSDINAKVPYDKHQTMQYNGNKFDFFLHYTDTTYSNSVARMLSRDYYRCNNEELYDTSLIKKNLEHSFDLLTKDIVSDSIVSLNWNRVIFYTPPYPAKAELKIQNKGLIGMIDKERKCRIFTVDPVLEYSGNTARLKYFFTGFKSVTIEDIKFVRQDSELIEELPNWKVQSNTIEFDKIGYGSICFLFTLKSETEETLVYCKLIHFI